MNIQIGKRYVCTQCATELIATRGGEGQLMCCGQPLELKQAGLKIDAPGEAQRKTGSVLGKRYRCASCGIEVLCTKAGYGELSSCDKPMSVQDPKPLPSSD